MLDDLPGVADNAKKILFDMKCTTVIDDCNVHLRDVLNLLEDEMHSFRLSSIEANDLDKLYDTFYYYGKKGKLMKIPNTIGITTLIHLLMSSLLIIKKQMELI